MNAYAYFAKPLKSAHRIVIMSVILLTAAFALAFGPSQATAGIVDPANDFLPSYTGPQNGDLDVLQTAVLFNVVTNQFHFTALLNGTVGATTGALYVWGIDRGQGTARFLSGTPSIGAGVLFDSVVVVRPDGTGNFNDILTPANSGALNPANITINGNQIEAIVPVSMIPTAGFAVENYTFNLWPRVGAGSNNQISDFAPDASNFALNAVPEPSSLALASLAGLVVVGARVWRRRARRGMAG